MTVGLAWDVLSKRSTHCDATHSLKLHSAGKSNIKENKTKQNSRLLKSLFFFQHVHCCFKHVYHILNSVANRLTLCRRSWTRCRAGSRSIWTEESGQGVMYWNRWPWEPSVFSLAVLQCGALLTRYKQQHWSLCDTAYVWLIITARKCSSLKCYSWHLSGFVDILPLLFSFYQAAQSGCPWQLKFIFERHWHYWSQGLGGRLPC